MKRAGMSILSALVLCGLRALPCMAEQSIEGDWMGGYKAGGNWTSVSAHFKTEKETIKGTLDVQADGTVPRSVDLNQLSLSGSHVRFQMPVDSAALTFEGQVNGRRISGTFHGSGARGEFELLRTARIDPGHIQHYVGAYRLGPRKFVCLGRFQTGDGSARFPAVEYLTYFDSFTERGGSIVALSDTEFTVGRALGLDYPIDIRIEFVRDRKGEIVGLK